MSTLAKGDRDNTPPTAIPTAVSEESTETGPHGEPSAKIAFESPQPSDAQGFLPPTVAPRDNITPTHATTQLPQPPQPPAPTEPKMGDTRTVNGQKQVYFLGFGWIEDNDTPNEAYYAEDMYENGNKVGNMGDGTVVDGDGDINKMVGTMD